MSSLKTKPGKVTPLKTKLALNSNLTSLSRTIEKAQKDILKNQMTPHSSEENLKPIGTPVSHFKTKVREKRLCADVNKTPLMSINKINKSPQSITATRTATNKSIQTNKCGTPKHSVITLSTSTPSKLTLKTAQKKLKTQKSPSKCATPISNETNILFQFSKDIFSTPREESNPPFNEGYIETGCTMERLNRSHSASSIFRFKNRGDEGTAMSKIKRSLSEAKLSMQSSCSEYEGEKSQITVGVRVRPLLPREGMNGVNVSDGHVVVASDLGSEFAFSYEHCFSPLSTQNEVYEALVRPLLDNALQGYNACLFAYGQTGSGKTYSMMGPSLEEDSVEITAESGMIPRFCKELLQKTAALEEACPSLTTSVEVSYLEVYNEKIHDLLVPGTTQLRVREHPVHGPYVVDLSRHTITSFNDFQHWINIGNQKRSTAMTELNDKSSRSHSLFTVLLTQTFAQVRSDGTWSHDQTRRSHINLVDLAGSERIASTTVSSDRLREGASINRSLLTLGKVMSALVDNRGFVPYRESVLTWLLKESLGGNSRTCMLATVSPCSSHLDETMSTLRYASQARAIVNRVRVNEAPQDKELRELREELERLRPAGERINNLLGEKEDLENQLKFKAQEILNLGAELEKYKKEVLELFKSKEELLEKFSAEEKTKEEFKKKLADGQMVGERMKSLEDKAVQIQIDLEKCRNDLNEEKKNVRELTMKLSNSKSKEDMLKAELLVMTQDLETARSQIGRQQQNQMKLMDEKLTFIKEMDKQRSQKTADEVNSERIFEENVILKKEMAILNERLSNNLKELREQQEELEVLRLSGNNINTQLAEKEDLENQLRFKAKEIIKLESEIEKYKKEVSEVTKNKEELMENMKRQISAEQKIKDELKKKLSDALTVGERLKNKADQAVQIEIDLEKCKNDLNEERKNVTQLTMKLSDIRSKEEMLKAELNAKIQYLETAQSQIEKQQQLQVTLMEEKLTLLKVMEKHCSTREAAESNNGLYDENAILKKEIAILNERLSNSLKELKEHQEELEVLRPAGKNINTLLAEKEDLENQLKSKAKELIKLESEMEKYKKEVSEVTKSKEELMENMKRQISAEQRIKDELKNNLSDAQAVSERMKFKADQAVRIEIELEKCKSDLNEERNNIKELTSRLSESKSKEDMLKAELHAKAQYLETLQSQIEKQQQLQVTLMEEKLTLLKVMEKYCSTKEAKESNNGHLEENAILKKDIAILNERLSHSLKENVELKKKISDTETLLKMAITNEEKKHQAFKAALENRDLEMYEFVMDSAFPHHLVHLVRKARSFTEIYKIPYEIELKEKTVTLKHLMISAKAIMNHLKLSKWIERIESEKTWFKSMDRDLPWEVDFGDYYEKNDAHKIILEDTKENKNSAINIGTKITASGCINPILWRKTMIKRHVMGLREDSDALIRYFNEMEDSRVYSILSRIQVSVARLQDATRNVEK